MEIPVTAAEVEAFGYEYTHAPASTKKLRKFVNGKKYVPFNLLSAEQQTNIINKEAREKTEGLFWEEADKEASLIELRYLRSKRAGEYKWFPETGWQHVDDILHKPVLTRSKRIRRDPNNQYAVVARDIKGKVLFVDPATQPLDPEEEDD